MRPRLAWAGWSMDVVDLVEGVDGHGQTRTDTDGVGGQWSEGGWGLRC
ncbi:MAG: hypothetical protein ABSH38_14875 [Verrucomicrobiota bacterium]